MSGIEQVLRLLATLMRGEEIPPLAIEQGNRDRRNMIPLLKSTEPLRDHSHLRRAKPGRSKPLLLSLILPIDGVTFASRPQVKPD